MVHRNNFTFFGTLNFQINVIRGAFSLLPHFMIRRKVDLLENDRTSQRPTFHEKGRFLWQPRMVRCYGVFEGKK